MNAAREKIPLLLVLGLLALMIFVRSRPARPAAAAVSVTAGSLAGAGPGQPAMRPVSAAPAARRENDRAGISRQEVAEMLKPFFRREQVEGELAIEQRRYGAGYWQTEAGGRQFRALDQERAALLQRLNLAMNGALDDLCGDEAGEPISLTPIFGPDRAGPNVTFLSADSRAKVVRLISDLTQAGPVDAAALLASARDILPAGEMAQYAQWNAPEMALLRTQLVGFNATEDEFNAISHWPNFVNQGSAETRDEVQAELALDGRIGTSRLADLIRLRDPDVQTAVHDLHRLGLPLDRAEWLADIRTRGAREIQQIWQDPALPFAAKTERVMQLQQTYRSGIVATLAPAAPLADESDLMP